MIIETPIKSVNYNRIITAKKQIVIGSTNNHSLNHISAIHRDGGTYKKIPHFTILKNGEIHQHIPTKYCSEFVDSEFHKDFISIALENIGALFLNGDYLDSYNNKFEGIPINKPWKNCEYWDSYSEEQIESALSLCNKLIDEYNICRTVSHTNVQKTDINNFKGICYRSNHDSKYYDVNPSFPLKDLKKRLKIK